MRGSYIRAPLNHPETAHRIPSHPSAQANCLLQNISLVLDGLRPLVHSTGFWAQALGQEAITSELRLLTALYDLGILRLDFLGAQEG